MNKIKSQLIALEVIRVLKTRFDNLSQGFYGYPIIPNT